ncbi:MAG TPA: sigma-70 family RNA polymerase sigma factor [Bryobacteraceae bacterium]|nr:sigma-70 family RNA polymerase sigma factor [Bryobacteraceae bacterium]
MPDRNPGDVTQLLIEWRDGDRSALDRMMPLVYDELRMIAGRFLRREHSNPTLQSTALVHEAYLRLVDQNRSNWENRAHFLGVAATIIRNILVDHARARKSAKRGGEAPALVLDEALAIPAKRDVELVALDDALTSLSRLDPQQGKIVELRFFGGLSIEETAEVLGISASTVKRDWLLAKTWIFRAIAGEKPGPRGPDSGD